MAAPTIDELTRGMGHLAADLQKSRESTESMVDQFTHLLQTLLPIGVAFKAFNMLSGQWGNNFSVALKTLTSSTREVLAERLHQESTLRTLRQKQREGEISVAQLNMAKKQNTEMKGIFSAQLHLQQAINTAGRQWLLIGAGIAYQATTALLTAQRYNESLQEATSDFQKRLSLMHSIARVQAATGASSGVVTSAAKALVRYNLESHDTFQANLRTVVQLHEALGLSVDESAHLAAVTENYARSSFQRVADVIATIVDQTALAASEVKNLGLELTRALGVIQPGGATALPQVIQALSGYEGALKEVSGRVGAFQRMVTGLATPEGLLGAGMLGVTPGMIQSEQGINELMRRFERFVSNTVGQSQGAERMWRLESAAKSLNIGLTREEISEMMRAMEIRRTQIVKETTLQERYNAEVMNLDQGVTRLLASLNSLLQQGIYPVVFVVSKAINGLAWLIQRLLDWQGVGYAAFGVVAAASIFAFGKLKSVAIAFWEVAMAARVATNNLRDYARTEMARAVTRRAAGLAAAAGTAGFSMTTAFVAALTWTGVAAGIAALAYIVYKWYNYNKQAKEETAAVNRALSMRSRTLEDARREQMYSKLRFGDPAGAMQAFRRWMQDAAVRVRRDGLSPDQQEAQLDAIRDQALRDMDRAFYTRTAMSDAFVRGSFNRQAVDAEMKAAILKMAVLADDAKTHNRKMYESEQEGQRQAARVDDEADYAWMRQNVFQPLYYMFHPRPGDWNPGTP